MNRRQFATPLDVGLAAACAGLVCGGLGAFLFIVLWGIT